MQELFLGKEKVSLLKRSIPREGFHCIQRQFKLPSEGASPAADSDSGAVEKWSGEYDEMWEERNMTAVVCLLKLLIHTLVSWDHMICHVTLHTPASWDHMICHVTLGSWNHMIRHVTYLYYKW